MRLSALALALALVSPAAAQDGPPPTLPRGTMAVISAFDGARNNHLWTTDGTAQGTRILARNFGSIWEYADAIIPTPQGGVFIQRNNNANNQRTLWYSPNAETPPNFLGTIPGIYLYPYPGYYPYGVALPNGSLLFTAFARDLWVSDGSDAGTARIAGPDTFDTSPFPACTLWFQPFGSDRALFSVGQYRGTQFGCFPNQLWITDGSPEGTTFIRDFPRLINGIWRIRDNLFIVDTSDLGCNYTRDIWVSDGTQAGTEFLRSFPTRSCVWFHGMARVETTGEIVFAVVGEGGHEELWATDGSHHGTVRVASSADPPFPRSWSNLTSFGDSAVLLSATTEQHGTELWIYDGISRRARLLRNISPGAASSNIAEITDLRNGQAVIRVGRAGGGFAFWSTDGTRAGTLRLTQWHHDGQDIGRFAKIVPGIGMFFQRSLRAGTEPWITNGERDATRIVRDLVRGTASSDPVAFAPIRASAAPEPEPPLFPIVGFDDDPLNRLNYCFGAHNLNHLQERFNYFRGQYHTGVDLRTRDLTPPLVQAPVDGEIVYYRRRSNSNANPSWDHTFAVLRGDDGRDYILAHMNCNRNDDDGTPLCDESRAMITDTEAYPPEAWRRVKRGTVLGRVPNNQMSSPHLHFGVVNRPIVDERGVLLPEFHCAFWARIPFAGQTLCADNSRNRNQAREHALSLGFIDPMSLYAETTTCECLYSEPFCPTR